ncbi:MAG: glycosyltransferase family 2 protein [Pseudolysinimonas sp.]
MAEPRTGVSYVMPVLNEVGYVEAAIRSVLEQDYSGPFEVVLALGPSHDGTRGIVEKMAAADARIRLVENPGMDIPIGLNLAIKAARYPDIIRVDAHTELAPGYTTRGVDDLERTGAASVGGIMVATGTPGFQAAVARAYNSRFGLGGGAYHGSAAVAGPAESAYLGVMRADALAEVGGFDETLRRGEDWELNYRFRQAGRIVWLDPELRVKYWPRSTPGKLARQFFATGVWRAELVRRLGGRNPLRFFAPPILVIATVLSIIAIPLHATGVLHGILGWIAALVYLGPLLYAVLLVVAAVTGAGSFTDRLRFMAVIAIMHFTWGAGFLRGIIRGGGNAVDTSRTES